jgi:5-methyltetrahydropteroyltriglutamate--homocysteine methyltransferase
MTIPTEPIGSIPRPASLIAAFQGKHEGKVSREQFEETARTAIEDTLQRFKETGSPIITDGEQAKPSFVTYPIDGLPNLDPDGVVIPFEDGHTRQLPRLTAGPFRYATYASSYLAVAQKLTSQPLKQAVISPSALSLLYPASGIPGYSRQEFLADLMNEAEKDIRSTLDLGADSVQIDFTEARLALKLDPSGGLLKSFIDLNNKVLERFSPIERRRIGVHTCPGGDHDATHSADVDYAGLLPALFRLRAGRFYVQLASETEPERVLAIIKENLEKDRLVFVGVIDPINPKVEEVELVEERVMQAAKHLPLPQLGTTDDCGFSPFADDTSTSRDIAFQKIRARVVGTQNASAFLARTPSVAAS